MSKSMNLDKVSKVESSIANRNSINWFLESSTASKPSGSKNDISPREDAVKNSLGKFSNKRLNVTSDGSKTLKSNLSSKPILCSSDATKPSPSNQNVVKTSATSSNNTTKIWNAYCRRLLCSFGGSKSKSSDLRQVKEKSVEGTSKIPHDCRNELRELMTRYSVASPKNGSSFSNNKEGLSNVVGQSSRSQQSNPSRLNKVQPVTVVKKQIKMTASPNDPQNLRKKVQKLEISKDSPVATRMRKIQKTESSKASIIANPKREIQKTESSKGSVIATPKREILITEGSKASMIASMKREIQKMEASIIATPKREIQKAESSKASIIATPKREIQKAESSKASIIATPKREIQKTEGSKGSMIATQKREILITEGSKASMIATTKREIQKTEGPKASMIATTKREIQKTEGSKGSMIAAPKRETSKKTSGSKVLAVSDKQKIGTGKTSTLLSSHDKKNQPSSSRYRPYSDIPVYHIKLDGHDKKSARIGHICILCNKDLSCLPQNDHGSHEDDEYKYRIELRPRLLPCADILPCGHVFHSDCLRFVIPEEQSNGPQCVFCLSMA